MGDAAGERTYRFHALGLLQARHQPCTFFFHGVPFDSIDDGIESHAHETEFVKVGNKARPAHRIETEHSTGTVLIDIRRGRPSANAKGQTRASVFSRRHPTDAWNVDNSIVVWAGARPPSNVPCWADSSE